VQIIKNQEKPVVCREKADTEVYVGGSKPLNHLQMIDFGPVSHQTLCMHGATAGATLHDVRQVRETWTITMSGKRMMTPVDP